MNNPTRKLLIRRATIADAGALTEFNQAMALETEKKRLVSDTVNAGVERAITDSRLGFYLIAEHGHEIVGSLMITFEWSDWRNGMFWWIKVFTFYRSGVEKGFSADCMNTYRRRARRM